jgi:hypothetical protein
MARISTWPLFIVGGLALGNMVASYTSALAHERHVGGTATTGTGVRTGRGPLSYPVPPASSTLNPPYNPQRPQNFRGPASTYPSPYPFGSPQ